ncbi:MAG: DUF1499 domain-containing protein [Gammaproteobacteria bacterium]
MTRMLLGIFGAVLLVVVAFAALGWWSQRAAPAARGVVDGRLAPCDAAPHCVCSDGDPHDAAHYVQPIELPAGDDAQRWRALREVVAMQGGSVLRQDDAYLHASFESTLFGFVDDVEFRLEDSRFAVRSSSRVGYSDLGANRQRVEALRTALAAQLGAGTPR